MIGTTSSNVSNISLVAGLALGDMILAVVITCSLLLAVMIINHIVHTAGGDHVDFGLDEDDQPEL